MTINKLALRSTLLLFSKKFCVIYLCLFLYEFLDVEMNGNLICTLRIQLEAGE